MIKGTENRNTGPLLIILRNKGTAERDGRAGVGGKKARGAAAADESKRAEEKRGAGTQKKQLRIWRFVIFVRALISFAYRLKKK